MDDEFTLQFFFNINLLRIHRHGWKIWMDSSYSDESAAVDDVFHDDSRVHLGEDILRCSAEEVTHFFHYSRFGHLH